MVGNELVGGLPNLDSEADAYAFLERLRWGDDGPTQCPHCDSSKGAWFLKPKNPEGRKSKGGSAARSQRRVWKCRENGCRRQFSVLTNTVMHATKMPVRAWVGTIAELCEEADGVSARDIAARWDITEKSAWAMLLRVQEALTEPEIAGASLASNAPLWSEVTAMDTIAFGGQKRELEENESPAETPPTSSGVPGSGALANEVGFDSKPESPSCESGSTSDSQRQVQSDVKRVLAEVFGDRVPVANGQGQLLGVAGDLTPELGPTWSMSAGDAANAQHFLPVPDDQLGRFGNYRQDAENHEYRS